MPTLSPLEVILAVAVVGGILAYGIVAMFQGVDGALQTTIIGAVIGVLVVIVLRKIPGKG